MEKLPQYQEESRRTGRRSMEECGASTNQTPFYTNTLSMTQGMTSPVTWASCCKSPNRVKLTHFCCCLHRRRTLLKRWSRRHREKAARLEDEQGDAGITQLHISHTQSGDSTHLHPSNLSFIGTSSNCTTSSTDLFKDDISLERALTKERLRRDMVLTRGVLDKLSLSKFSSNVISCDDSGANFEAPRCLPTGQDVHIKESHFKLHTTLRPFLSPWTGVGYGRLVFDLVSGVTRLLPSANRALRRLTGGAREGRVGGRYESKLGLNPATQMTFHRWVTVLLVCIMVLPVNSTAAPGLPWQGSVVEEPGNEPGYKNSYYAELPPKAEYESVIICLLAVSAFIGLIVWVLKSNFEERQQKRMRREASLRERTSSVAFLKT